MTGGRIAGPCLTVFTSDRNPLTKRFTLQDGVIHKKTYATLYAGEAETKAARTPQALAGILDGLKPGQAIASGRLIGSDHARITTEAQKKLGYVTRSLDHFAFDAGPGWLLWDFDAKTMPGHVAERVKALGGPLAALFHIWPEAEGGSYLVRPSSSGGISAPGLPPTENAGLHGFFLVQDVSQSRAILDALQARAWVAGLAWIALSKSGGMLVRSIVDTAVGSPERLIFEAPPILDAPLIRAQCPPVIGGGAPLDAPAAPQEAATRAENDARARIKPKAVKAETAFVDERAEMWAQRTGKSRDEARAAVRAMLAGATLSDDDVLQLKNGDWARVGDLLDSPANHGLALPDPIEGLAYGSDKATLLLTPRPGYTDEKPRLVSHAHGQRTVYRFERYEAPEAVPEDVVLPAPADLPNGGLKALQAALAGCDGAAALSVAVAVAYRLLRRVPVEMSIDDVMAFLAAHLPPGAVTDAERAAIEARLVWLQDRRRRGALQHVNLPASVKNNHDLTQVPSLEALPPEALRGVICVRAPMGKGKTQRIGKPFAEWAKTQGGGVMAICHRVTLTGELSRRLDLADYLSATTESIAEKGGVAVCLPSTTREWMAEAMPKPRFVFVDEIAQVLQFLAAEGHCRTRSASAAGVFGRLVQIVRDAEVVLVADAGLDARSIDFLEYCRPGERFQVFEMQAEAEGKRAEVLTGAQPDEVKQAIVDRALAELAAGGKVWLATESKDLAETLEGLFSAQGFNAISITATNKADERQEVFLKSAESASRLYDVVIASPAISSGLSIEHRGDPHFTLGAYIGAGVATPPADAGQQLGRVRYLRRFAVGIMRNNLQGGQTWEAIVDGLQGAAAIEGTPARATTFDTMVGDIAAQADNARADFGAGLWWLLEGQGWTLERTRAGATDGAVKAAEDAMDAARQAALINADQIDDATAEMLKAGARSASDELRLEAWKIRKAFGVFDLDDAAIDWWDAGRGMARLERFEDLTDATVERRDDGGNALVHRRYRLAQVQLYADLFEGFDISRPDWCGPDAVAVIVDRVMARADVYTAVGIVGPKYRARFPGKGGKMKPAARPTGKKATWMVKDILDRAGLVWVSKRLRLSQTPPFLVTTNGGVWDTSAVSDDNRHRIGGTCPDSFAAMTALIDRRAVFDLDADFGARVSADPELTTVASPPEPGASVPQQPEPVKPSAVVDLRQALRDRADRVFDEYLTRPAERVAKYARVRDAPPVRRKMVSGGSMPVTEVRPAPRLVWLCEAQPRILSAVLRRYKVTEVGVQCVWDRAVEDAVQAGADLMRASVAAWHGLTESDPDAWQ